MRTLLLARAALAFALAPVVGPHLVASFAPETAAPRVFLVDPDRAVRARTVASESSPAANVATLLAAVRAAADRDLAAGPWSVIDKPNTPPSGDKHDYLSLAPYWWPDPARPDGLPYIRRDGEVNPASRLGDEQTFSALASAVPRLALAYYLTGEVRYAQRAALLLRTWFLAPATRMNPNLDFGQGVPGRNTGRAAGLIETRRLPDILDAVGLLAGSDAWTPDDQRAMEEWARAYLAWLRTSANGREESRAKNNHGSFYDAQVASLALFTAQPAIAREAFDRARRRMEQQIEADGRQPEELARTRSWHYSVFNLEALARVAALGDRAGLDLWTHTWSGKRSLRSAIDYLVPVATGEQPWPHPQIEPVDLSKLAPVLALAGDRLADARYRALAATLAGTAPPSDWRLVLLHLSQAAPAK